MDDKYEVRWAKAQWREARQNAMGLLLAMTPFWALFPALGVMLVVISPPFVGWLLGEALETGDAAALLVIARRWYRSILGGMALAVLLSFGMVIWALRRLRRRGQLAQLAGYLGIMAFICVGGEALLFGALIDMEELPQHITWATEDLESIEKDQLETAVCFVSPKSHPYRLPGPYTKDLPEPLVRYGIIGPDTGDKWVDVLAPNGLGFALDEDRFYDENRTIGWNEENAQQYLVRYTVNLHIVAEITPWNP